MRDAWCCVKQPAAIDTQNKQHTLDDFDSFHLEPASTTHSVMLYDTIEIRIIILGTTNRLNWLSATLM